MSQTTNVISFIRNHIKYKAAKKYVGGLSGDALSRLWRTINETEMFGMRHKLYCGNIDVNTLRSAFLREMSYNPIRFPLKDAREYSAQTTEIINSVQDILGRFEKLWPTGISGSIYIIDASDAQYKLMRDIRDCFRAIARQNTADLKLAEYRDEIVAWFANDMSVKMTANMRDVLQNMAAQTAQLRVKRRNMSDIYDRIAVLEKQMGLHVASDRDIYLELQAECDALKMQLDEYRNVVHPQHKKCQSAKPKQKVVVAPLATDSVCEDAGYDSDAAEREMELLRSMTPDHTTDEIFQDYAEKITGQKLYKPFGGNQR